METWIEKFVQRTKSTHIARGVEKYTTENRSKSRVENKRDEEGLVSSEEDVDEVSLGEDLVSLGGDIEEDREEVEGQGDFHAEEQCEEDPRDDK